MICTIAFDFRLIMYEVITIALSIIDFYSFIFSKLKSDIKIYSWLGNVIEEKENKAELYYVILYIIFILL